MLTRRPRAPVANHYIHARDIPTSNVILLSDVPTGLRVELEDFKSKILRPVLATLDQRGIAAQARVIAYSADFPTAVNVADHAEELLDPKLRQLQAGVASITGATFFYRFVLADQIGYLGLGANMYARGPFERHFVNPFQGDNKEKFAAAEKDLADGKHEAAAEVFQELFEQLPTLAPLALRAAEAYAAAGEDAKAVQLVASAIRAGWWSGAYLQNNDLLKPLLDDPALAPVMPMMRKSPTSVQGPVGFANHRGYTAIGHPVAIDKGGIPYLLSCCLAVVHERGSTVQQAVDSLERSAKADGTFPSGDFRFAGGGDVRAKTRFPQVADALVYLQNLGHKTEVFRSDLPTSDGDVVGLMVGKAAVDLASRKWRLVPGAIAENLTSYGGAYHINGHTKITEFLHAGAAMSSGTVVEPYALQAKFPLPIMYGYYADGVSAIEAFYLSVTCPYQLLIVGDPICQPFARAPGAWVDISVSKEKKDRIQVSAAPLDVKQPTTRTRETEVYIGGRLVKQTGPAAKMEFGIPPDTSGVVEVRVALIGLDPTEPKVSFTANLDLSGPLATPVATVTQPRTADSKSMQFKLECKNADTLELLHLGQIVGTIKGQAGTITVDTKPLGDGPLRFRAQARFGDTIVQGMPVIDQLPAAQPE